MFCSKLKVGLLASSLMFAAAIQAQDEHSGNEAIAAELTPVDSSVEKSASSAAAAEDPTAIVAQNVRKHLGDFQITSISETDVPGLYELVSGGTILYVNQAGTRLFEGEMIDLENRVSLTEQRLGKLHMDMLVDLPEDQMLTYKPENPSGRSITVFTDISCGFCQRLHREIDTLLDNGVAVNYLLFPRAGYDTPAADALESVWCNENQQEAMTTAKLGARVPPASCDNPIQAHMALAQQVGLRGTPLIYLDTGVRVPGYRDAATLVEMVMSEEKYIP